MLGHAGKACTCQWVCKVPGCTQRHNTWLHSALATIFTSDNNNNNNQQTTPNNRAAESDQTKCQQPVHAHAMNKELTIKSCKIALPIVPVVVSDVNNDYSMKVYTLLDNRANSTFCSRKLIHALKLQPEKVQISLNMMGTRLENINMERVDISEFRCRGTRRASS